MCSLMPRGCRTAGCGTIRNHPGPTLNATLRSTRPLSSPGPTDEPYAPLPRELAVDVDVGLVGIERDETGDLRGFVKRRRIRPRHICRTATHRPVLGLALVGAVRDSCARLEQVETNVRLRQVEARW